MLVVSKTPLIFLKACVRKNFKLCKFVSPLQEPVRTEWSVCKIINMKLCLVNIANLIGTKIVMKYFNTAGNKQEITAIIVPFLRYTIYNANKYQ